jgi:hypothetical protein
MNADSISQARVVEIGDVTAGIVIAEENGFRFFSAQRPFDPLDGRVFRSIKRAIDAAQDRLQRSGPPPRSRQRPNEDVDPNLDLPLAIPRPFLLPV